MLSAIGKETVWVNMCVLVCTPVIVVCMKPSVKGTRLVHLLIFLPGASTCFVVYRDGQFDKTRVLRAQSHVNTPYMPGVDLMVAASATCNRVAS